MIPRTDFERRFPDADVSDFDADTQCGAWRDAGQVRIAEYWWKDPRKRELLALSDGRVVFADEIAAQAGLGVEEAKTFLESAGVQIVRTRTIEGHRVLMRLTNGHTWLTEPYEFPCQFIPIVPVWGISRILMAVITGRAWCVLVRTSSAYITYIEQRLLKRSPNPLKRLSSLIPK
ncbi:hypothetical protein [Xylella fastidiosa]|uniref:portal protein n=1 Tax=Xylella fastidiosa TaxID=2371 RepID=UPI003984CED5